MKRSTIFLTVLMLSAVVTGLLASLSSAEAAGGNCQAKVVGNSYDCNFTDNDFPPFTECWTFFTGGFSQFFDLDDNDFSEWGCACNPKGSAFDSSSSTFECTDGFDPFMLNVKIQGKKLSAQGIGVTGEQYIGTCTQRSSACP